MAENLVSVVVPTFNRPAMLREALASIRAQETSGYAVEILVGDNGENAETRKVSEEFDARYLKVVAPGAGAARNAGYFAANGDLIAFLDDDDVWLPGTLGRRIAYLNERAGLDAAFGQIINTDQELRPISDPWPIELPENRELLLRTMLSGYFPQIGATLTRARVREGLGGFDESLIGDQDWDWQLRLARKYNVGFMAEPCVHFRQRAPGSYDALQSRRIPFTKQVFIRHALASWQIWRSPINLVRAYNAILQQFFQYFLNSVILRSDENDYSSARDALKIAFRHFPLRMSRQIMMNRRLRKASIAAIASHRSSNPAITFKN